MINCSSRVVIAVIVALLVGTNTAHVVIRLVETNWVVDTKFTFNRNNNKYGQQWLYIIVNHNYRLMCTEPNHFIMCCCFYFLPADNRLPHSLCLLFFFFFFDIHTLDSQFGTPLSLSSSSLSLSMFVVRAVCLCALNSTQLNVSATHFIWFSLEFQIKFHVTFSIYCWCAFGFSLFISFNFILKQTEKHSWFTHRHMILFHVQWVFVVRSLVSQLVCVYIVLRSLFCSIQHHNRCAVFFCRTTPILVDRMRLKALTSNYQCTHDRFVWPFFFSFAHSVVCGNKIDKTETAHHHFENWSRKEHMCFASLLALIYCAWTNLYTYIYSILFVFSSQQVTV